MLPNRTTRQYLLSAIIIIAVTFLAAILGAVLTLANFTAIYILVVLIIAVNHGTIPALFIAFLSVLSINFFVMPPHFGFFFADITYILDLTIFFTVAVIAGQLAAHARQQTATANQRAHEQRILYQLTRSFNQLTTSEGVYNALSQVLETDLAAQHTHISPYGANIVSSDQTVYHILLQAGGKIYSTLCATFNDVLTSEQERLINTCASQAAMALQRIDLAERARKSQQFEEADRLKTAILHAVSHDLRTPITIIKTSASNLRNLRERLSLADWGELTTTIETETDHLDKLIGNLLDMSRLQAGALQLNKDFNSLEEVAGDAAARVWQLTKEERIKIVFADDMPLVPFDYGLLLQVLSNLIDNALRYEPPDRLIEIRGCVQDDEAQIRVVNHGEAILESEREHIMEPFYRGKDGHIGLGLPIAKGIVEAHHGQLDVEDTPGGGVTFVIGLPMEKGKS